jgi:hypothetical protein
VAGQGWVQSPEIAPTICPSSTTASQSAETGGFEITHVTVHAPSAEMIPGGETNHAPGRLSIM